MPPLSSVSAALNIIISFTLPSKMMLFGSLFYEFFIKIKSSLILWALTLSTSNGFDLKRFVLMIVILKISCCFQAHMAIIINTDGAKAAKLHGVAYGKCEERIQVRLRAVSAGCCQCDLLFQKHHSNMGSSSILRCPPEVVHELHIPLVSKSLAQSYMWVDR